MDYLIMAIFTFSTKVKRPADTAIVNDVKRHCVDNHLNFSGLIVKLLREYKDKEGIHDDRK